MKPLRNRLQEARTRLGLPWEALERDYLLSWVLAGITQVSVIRETLVFKGGTALKKCYFGDYRFSEDLDFSATEKIITPTDFDSAMQEVCDKAMKLVDPFAPVEIVCERHVERDPHPGSQLAFDIRARFPWQRNLHTNVMVEISVDEKVLKSPVQRSVIHDYGEPFDFQLPVYAMEEIVAEKLRAILQHVRTLERRGWVRSRARDYYDLWRILNDYKEHLDLSGFKDFLNAKCAIRDVTFTGPESFFPEALLANVQKTWDQWLSPLVPQLPSYKEVIEDLRKRIAQILQ
jgi:predicted nucleotidyltransferase component of viral defense system